MMTSGFYKFFSLSIVLHLLVFASSIILVRNQGHMPRIPYVVSIVDEPITTSSNSDNIEKEIPDSKETRKEPVAVKTQDRFKKNEEHIVSERIAALKAKKKLEKVAAIRRTIDVNRQKNDPLHSVKATQSGSEQKMSGEKDYYSLVEGKIKQNWVYPESLDRELETIITIKISKDGSITIRAIEKSSGNRLFDRSVIGAIAKAGPFPPPPNEMEIGVRFRP
ncbi:MAG: cell envelope integrity protein TolA [Thermodesulfovibrionales bacterium]|nr:cell envelope integrity protein TolA [Thermodesulfovibrionales bacterium]